jgi:hypothetical protein
MLTLFISPDNFSPLVAQFAQLFPVDVHAQFENQQKIVTFALRLSLRKSTPPKVSGKAALPTGSAPLIARSQPARGSIFTGATACAAALARPDDFCPRFFRHIG